MESKLSLLTEAFEKEVAALPSWEEFVAMDPRERAAATVRAWDLRQTSFGLVEGLGEAAGRDPDTWGPAALAALELNARARRHERCGVELAAMLDRPLANCVANLKAAVAAASPGSGDAGEE